MSPEDSEPLLCPECGERPEIKHVEEYGEYLHIYQCKCGYHKTGSYYDINNAIKEWNHFARVGNKKKELGPVSNGSLADFLNKE